MDNFPTAPAKPNDRIQYLQTVLAAIPNYQTKRSWHPGACCEEGEGKGAGMSSRIEARWYSQNNMKPRGGEDTHSTFQYPVGRLKEVLPGSMHGETFGAEMADLC